MGSNCVTWSTTTDVHWSFFELGVLHLHVPPSTLTSRKSEGEHIQRVLLTCQCSCSLPLPLNDRYHQRCFAAAGTPNSTCRLSRPKCLHLLRLQATAKLLNTLQTAFTLQPILIRRTPPLLSRTLRRQQGRQPGGIPKTSQKRRSCPLDPKSTHLPISHATTNFSTTVSMLILDRYISDISIDSLSNSMRS